MITSSNFNHNGRLGNMLFRYAALIGLADKHSTGLSLPMWKYSDSFTEPFPQDVPLHNARKVKEPMFHYIPEWPYIKENENVDIDGYLQSEKYWEQCVELVRSKLAFKPEFVDHVRSQFPNVFDRPTIAVSVRRGDYVKNPNYAQLPITYYILALLENFPDWREHNIVVFSDDIPYCRVHFDCLENVSFSEGNSDIEDLCLMSQCTHFIMSNSTFSWWGAYLGEKEGTKIVHPNYLFDGDLAKHNDSKDFYPERWITFDHKIESGNIRGANKRINLKDSCFTIPVAYDHRDRRENLDLCVSILNEHFETNILVYEQGTKQELKSDHFANYGGKFHRTKMLNEMARASNAEYILNWDADVIIPPFQILETINKLRAGADMVYPYEWAFARMPRAWYSGLRDQKDIGIVGDTKFSGMESSAAVSLGGAVAFKKSSFVEGGMENENFISYGAEDVERKVRFERLGYKIERTLGVLYHINHFVGKNSSPKHSDFANNNAEFDKVNAMSADELRLYISLWPWTK